MYIWQRYGGYEVSTKGDSRFSALVATLYDGRTIEEHYQCDIKGYDVGGTNWRLGKGKPPINPNTDTWSLYLILWTVWATSNTFLIDELRKHADKNNKILSDRFATSNINQARALACILNT